jgi:UDP-N-acetyl-D-galactosamine dehydrogenase
MRMNAGLVQAATLPGRWTPVPGHTLSNKPGIDTLAFKENCPDLRNTRVVDIVQALEGYSAQVDVFDPWVDASEARHEYGITPIAPPVQGTYDAIVLAVGHEQLQQLGGQGVRAFGKVVGSVVYDVKCLLPRDAVDGRL